LLGIHAAIAAADAFTIRHLGVRCASDRHEDAAEIVERVTDVAEVRRAAQHLRRVLMKKGWIEYSDHEPRLNETSQICEHARRLVEFVGRNLA
jgi:CRISPR/Cas system-associated protein Cas10 (large subunit of type III CRISPR-Cas system)